MMRRLSHSRVVKLLGAVIEDGNYCLVMEYMEKGNLLHVLQAQVEMPLGSSRIEMISCELLCGLLNS